jgi:hypothetical protein
MSLEADNVGVSYILWISSSEQGEIFRALTSIL